MSAMFTVSAAEQAGWQRRAAAELMTMLDVHRDLPVITWTVRPAGATLSGRVTGAGGEQVTAVFHRWRSALDLAERSQTGCGSGTCYLRAVAWRDRVWVVLTATVYDDLVQE